ncbi:MAG: TraB/GumN family protein [Candidatus Woesearchaeota archaeon]|nr:MAG: TraB/GumN family protein [Candidatus Woesearchaeota archaeon]
MAELTLVGSSHVARDSIKGIKKVILEKKPNIVAIELDQQRLQALFKRSKGSVKLSSIRKIGLMGFIFTVIGKLLQEKLGKVVGIAPGSDMKSAVLAAKKINATVFLIDKNIVEISRDISTKLTFFEKIKIILYIVGGLIYTPFMTIFKKPKKGVDISKVPPKEMVKELVGEFKKRFPRLYEILITDRNKHMAASLNFLVNQNKNNKIVAVVGAGHISGIKDILKNKYSIKVK